MNKLPLQDFCLVSSALTCMPSSIFQDGCQSDPLLFSSQYVLLCSSCLCSHRCSLQPVCQCWGIPGYPRLCLGEWLYWHPSFLAKFCPVPKSSLSICVLWSAERLHIEEVDWIIIKIECVLIFLCNAHNSCRRPSFVVVEWIAPAGISTNGWFILAVVCSSRFWACAVLFSSFFFPLGHWCTALCQPSQTLRGGHVSRSQGRASLLEAAQAEIASCTGMGPCLLRTVLSGTSYCLKCYMYYHLLEIQCLTNWEQFSATAQFILAVACAHASTRSAPLSASFLLRMPVSRIPARCDPLIHALPVLNYCVSCWMRSMTSAHLVILALHDSVCWLLFPVAIAVVFGDWSTVAVPVWTSSCPATQQSL